MIRLICHQVKWTVVALVQEMTIQLLLIIITKGIKEKENKENKIKERIKREEQDSIIKDKHTIDKDKRKLGVHKIIENSNSNIDKTWEDRNNNRPSIVGKNNKELNKGIDNIKQP